MTDFNPGSDIISVSVNDGEDTVSLQSTDMAEFMLSEILSVLRKSSVPNTSFDEQRNKAIYYLNGEVVSDTEQDADDVPFPWMNGITMTRIERVNEIRNLMDLVLDFYLANADNIEVADSSIDPES